MYERAGCRRNTAEQARSVIHGELGLPEPARRPLDHGETGLTSPARGPSGGIRQLTRRAESVVEVVMMTESRDVVMPDTTQREKAIARLKAKRDFLAHLFAYAVINGVLVAIWFITGAPFFWPIIPMLIWGVGLVFHAREVYWERPIAEEDIRREMDRMH
jgi:2TM domain